MSELCSVPRVSRSALPRAMRSTRISRDSNMFRVNVRRPFAVWEFGRWGTSFSIFLIDTSTFTRSWFHRDGAHRDRVHDFIATVDRVVQKQPRPRMQVTEVSLVDETGVLQVAFFPSAPDCPAA